VDLRARKDSSSHVQLVLVWVVEPSHKLGNISRGGNWTKRREWGVHK